MSLAVAVTKSYSRSLNTLRDQMGAAAERQWGKLPAYNESDVEALAAALDGVTALARQNAAHLTAGYLYNITGKLHPVTVTDLPVFDPLEQWRQPFISTWLGLKDGHDYTRAVLLGAKRASTVGYDLVTEASRSAMDFVGSQEPRITGWDWVAEGGCCDWCAERSGVDWGSAEETVFTSSHDNCRCDITPITSDEAPGAALNAERVAA